MSTQDFNNYQDGRWHEAAHIEPLPIESGDPIIRDLSLVKPKAVEWLWPSRIARGKVSMIAGDPGVGKSFVSIDLAARLSTGAEWPDHAPGSGKPGGVVLLGAEDDLADTVVPRLMAAGANLSWIKAVEGVAIDRKGKARAFTLADVETLEKAIQSTRECKLVVIDPIGAFLGRIDSHRNDEVRALLAPISQLAGQYGVAVVLVAHLNKGTTGKAIYRISGSLGFAAAARSVFAAAKDDEDPARRLFVPIKSNIGNDQTGLSYQIQGEAPDTKVVWSDEPITQSADELIGGDGGNGGGSPKVEEAAAWLREQLKAGPVESKEIERRGKDAGHSFRTLERAKPLVGVKTRPGDRRGAWLWYLSPGSSMSAKSANGGGLADSGGVGGKLYGPGPSTPDWARH